MSAFIRVASVNQNITVPQYFQQSVVSATQKNVYYMDGNVGIGQAVPTSKLVVDGSTSIGYPTTAAPTNGLIVSGSVGIGVTNPQAKLHVNGNLSLIYPSSLLATSVYGELFPSPGTSKLIDVGWSLNGLGGDVVSLFTPGYASSTPKLSFSSSGIIHLNGYVGIGNTNPQFPLDVATYSASPSINSSYFIYNGSTTTINTFSGWWQVGVKSIQSVWTTAYFVSSSDTRIKTNIQDINDETALSQLRLLQPKTYEYIDKVQRGSDPVIGFIAQEVAEVLPRAVTKQKEIIPSIYAIASVSDGVLVLEKEHGLVVGDKVKLIKEQGGELVTTVKEVLSTMSFTVDDTIDEARIFVYGKEVPDFHTLDKNAIFTIGVAAVQELDRQVQDHKSRIASLEERLAALEQRLS